VRDKHVSDTNVCDTHACANVCAKPHALPPSPPSHAHPHSGGGGPGEQAWMPRPRTERETPETLQPTPQLLHTPLGGWWVGFHTMSNKCVVCCVVCVVCCVVCVVCCVLCCVCCVLCVVSFIPCRTSVLCLVCVWWVGFHTLSNKNPLSPTT